MNSFMKTKEKILVTSIDLFNKNGVTVITTNHIAKAMTISPGNLYFHYDNKEEILIELFKRMCKDTYHLWSPQEIKKLSALSFIDQNFEIYWKYRFFHREMYALRRKDPLLAKMWRAHIKKVLKSMEIVYRHWVDSNMMTQITDRNEMLYVSEALMAMSTTFLQFFESSEKQPGKDSILRGKQHIARLLLPYTLNETKSEFSSFILGK